MEEDIFTIYLYHLKFKGENPKPDTITAHYYFNPAGGDVMTYIPTLVKQVYEQAERHTTCFGTRMEDIVWRRKSYLAVTVEVDDDREIEDNLKLDFEHKKIIGYGDAKHTIGDSQPIKVTVPTAGGTKTIRGAYAPNLVTKDGGPLSWLMSDSEKFKYKLKFKHKKRLLVGVGVANEFEDSGGTNMGPPVPPPNLIIS